MSTTNGYYPSPIKTRLSESEPVPKGWRWVELQDVARLESGHTPSRKVVEYWEGGDVPWLSLKDIRGMTSRYVMDTIDKPTMLGIDNSSARVLPKGTVAFCRTASIGNVAILGQDMATSQDFVDWVCGPELLPEFLYEAFKASGPTFANEMQGSTHKTIYMPTVERFKILLPPLSEQKRIADILDKANTIRRKRQEAQAVLEHLPVAAFDALFGDPRVNAHGWPEKQLKTLIIKGDKINYGIVQPGSHVEDGVPIVRVGDLRQLRVSIDGLKRVDPAIDQRHAKSRLVGDEILVACVGSVGTVALSDDRLTGFNIVRAVARIRCSDAVNRQYLAAYLATPSVQSYFKNSTRTVSQPTLNIKQIEETPVLVPPRSLQTRFAECVSTNKKALIRCEEAVSETQALFDSLIQRAFKGTL
jgi:type I restriction enzyme S subunit